MRALDQRSFDQRSPSALRQIETPDRIPTYQETRVMCMRLDAYFVRKGIHWESGREAFMFGIPKKKTLDKPKSTHDRSA